MMGRIFLGRYEVVKLLGEGGMGRVYLARQLDLGRQVVVKVMHDHLANDPIFCERFQRETLLMARFQHPYAVTLHDASLNDPQGPCIIMEFIRGVTLDTLLRRSGRLSAMRITRLLSQLCEVLHAAHSEGIIHRDLKPSNIMVVDPDTPYEKIKVMDFGLAKLVTSNSKHEDGSGSSPEFAVGTPGYMCPEQARGEEMDHRGDLYSVGVILFELLTGKLPFTGPSTMDTLLAHVTQPPPSFADVGVKGAIQRSVERVVQGFMAKDPADRPATARELYERYELALEQPDDESGEETVVYVEAGVSADTPAPGNSLTQTFAPVEATEDDPHLITHQLEAWMPEMIAAHKLRGFVQDAGGEIIENVPGKIRVRLGEPGSIYGPPLPRFSLFGVKRKSHQIEMELYLRRCESATRGNHLDITVALRPANKDRAPNVDWQHRCSQIFCDLRGYLMGTTGPVAQF